MQGNGGLNNFTSKFFIEIFAGNKEATLYNRCHDVIFWGIEPMHLQAESYTEESRLDPKGDLGLLKAFVNYILKDVLSVPRW